MLSSLHTLVQLGEVKSSQDGSTLSLKPGPVDSEWESSEGEKKVQQKTEALTLSKVRNESFSN